MVTYFFTNFPLLWNNFITILTYFLLICDWVFKNVNYTLFVPLIPFWLDTQNCFRFTRNDYGSVNLIGFKPENKPKK